MSPDDDLPTIDPQALDTVTGGTASNDDVTAAVEAISSSLKDFISTRKSSNADMFTQMLPFIMMMAGGGGGGFSSCGGGFSSCACGVCGCRPCRCHRR